MQRACRQLLAVFLAILILSMLVSGQAEELADNLELVVGAPFLYAVQGDIVWIVSGREATIYDETLQTPMKQFRLEFECEHIAADENAAYFLVKGKDGQKVVRLDAEGIAEGEWAITPSLNIVQMEAVEDELILVVNPKQAAADEMEHMESNGFGELYALSLVDGKVVPIGNETVTSIGTISCSSQYIGAYDTVGGTLYLLDRRSKELKGQFSVPNATYFSLTEDGSCFLLPDTIFDFTFSRLDLESGRRQTIGSLESSLAGLRAGGNYLYTMNWETNSLNAIPIPEKKEAKTTLTVLDDSYATGSERFRAAIAMTQEEFPDVVFEFEACTDPTPMIASLLAGKSDYDILVLQEYGLTNTRQYYRAGALVDLSKSERIMQAYDNLIDIKGIFSCDGGVFAVPCHVQPLVWQVNKTLFATLGLDIPTEDWTWDDFFALSVQVAELRKGGKDVVLLADADPYILMQYNINELNQGVPDYLSPDFIERMEQWKAAVESGAISAVYADWGVASPENALLTSKELSNPDLSSYTYVYPPVYADYVKIPVKTISVAVNPKSKHPEIVECFLTNYISTEVLSMEETVAWEGCLLQDSSTCRKYPYYPEDFYPTEKNEQFWKDCLENGVQFSVISEFMYDQMYEWYPQYLSGEMTIEQFASLSQERADMALGE